MKKGVINTPLFIDFEGERNYHMREFFNWFQLVYSRAQIYSHYGGDPVAEAIHNDAVIEKDDEVRIRKLHTARVAFLNNIVRKTMQESGKSVFYDGFYEFYLQVKESGREGSARALCEDVRSVFYPNLKNLVFLIDFVPEQVTSINSREIVPFDSQLIEVYQKKKEGLLELINGNRKDLVIVPYEENPEVVKERIRRAFKDKYPLR